MIRTKLNTGHRKDNGFTIVELLIVIVVIGILAAITLISYNGITNRANASKAVSNAEQVQKKAEAFNADPQVTGANPLVSGNGYYPASAAIFNAIPSAAIGSTSVTLLANSLATTTATVGSTTTFATAVTAAGVPTAANATSAVIYLACAPTAANNTSAFAYLIGYFDQSKGQLVWLGSSNLASVPPAGTSLATITQTTAPIGVNTYCGGTTNFWSTS